MLRRASSVLQRWWTPCWRSGVNTCQGYVALAVQVYVWLPILEWQHVSLVNVYDTDQRKLDLKHQRMRCRRWRRKIQEGAMQGVPHSWQDLYNRSWNLDCELEDLEACSPHFQMQTLGGCQMQTLQQRFTSLCFLYYKIRVYSETTAARPYCRTEATEIYRLFRAL